MFEAKYSAMLKTSAAGIIFIKSFLPRKTITKATHPRPLEIFGTKLEIRAA